MRGSLPDVTPYLRLGGREWRWPTAVRALAHRNFRLFWFGQFISLVGAWMQGTALQWLVYRLTGSSFRLGLLTFASFLPVLVLSPIAGVLVDRVDRRRLVTACQTAFLLQAAVLAGLTFSGLIQYWHILALAFLLGIAIAFEMPARQAFVVELVGREDLMNAIALNSSVFNGARILGPALAGVIVAGVGEAAAFGLNSASYLAVIVGLLAMRLRPPDRVKTNRHPLRQMEEGLRYVAGHETIRTLIFMVAILSFFGMPYIPLIPVFAGNVLGGGAEVLGLLLSAMGAGALAAALSLAVLGSFRRKGWLVTAGTLIFAVSVAVFALSRWLPLSMLALAGAGWAQITQLATINTLIQIHVDDALRGRVMSTFTWMLSGMFPLGSLLIGFLAQHWNAPAAVFSSALICGAFALAAAWRLPLVRKLE